MGDCSSFFFDDAGPKRDQNSAPVRPPASIYSALVRTAQSGEGTAFGALYERYCEPIYRYCLARARSSAEAEDPVSEVFLRAMEALPRYELIAGSRERTS